MLAYRAWINQPSVLQRLHRLHGTMVLATAEPGRPGIRRVYFPSGPVVSMDVPAECLSVGWPHEEGARA